MSALAAQVSWRDGLVLRGRSRVVPEDEAEAVLASWVHAALYGAAEAPQDGWFVAQLEERTLGVTCLEPGFKVVGRAADGAWVRRDGLRLWLPLTRGVMTPHDAKVGAAVRVRLPCARELATPGAYTVVARAGPPSAAQRSFEVFVSATSDGVLGLVEALLTDPAVAHARFTLAAATTPAQREGTGALVLSVDQASLRLLRGWLASMARAHRDWFREGQHPLALPCSKGVSAAESPRGGSFACHRALLIARGLLRALRHGQPWEQGVEQAFSAAKLQWAQPWLGEGSAGWASA